MSDPTVEKRRPGNPAMRKGAPSLNPAGRPRVGQSLAEAVRAAVTPEELAEKMLKLADGAESEQVRYSALAWLGERGHGKVPTTGDLTLRQGEGAAEYDVSKLPLEKRRELLEQIRALKAGSTDEPEAA
jgi:hypothetical protein